MRPAHVARLVLALPLAGCATWHQHPTLAPGAAASLATPARVTLADGRTAVLARARVAGDSIIGEEGDPPQRRSFALREVARVEGRRVSLVRTLGLGWLALNAAAGVLLLVFLAS
jgi:hypothetical protein